jgi:hypothetical protein
MGERFFEYHYSRTGFSVTPGLHSEVQTKGLTYVGDYPSHYNYPQGFNLPNRTVTYGPYDLNVPTTTTTTTIGGLGWYGNTTTSASIADSRGLVTKTSTDLQARRNEKQTAIAPTRWSSGWDYPSRQY